MNPAPPVGVGSSPSAQPKLLDLVRGAIRARHYSLRTEEAYVAWVKRFIFHHGKRHPATMGPPEITEFLTALAVRRRVSASTQNQALAALLFLYREVLGRDPGWLDGIVRAQRPRRLPAVLTRLEVERLLAALRATSWIMGMLLYGAGLRLIECLRLRVKDVEFQRHEILVREGKGNKDRVTMLPRATEEPLRLHLERVRRLHASDLAAGFGRVALPDALARSTRMPIGSGAGNGSSRRRRSPPIRAPVSSAGITCTSRCCRRRSAPPRAKRELRSPRDHTRCGTVSRRIFWKTGTTSAPCRSSSATATWRRR